MKVRKFLVTARIHDDDEVTDLTISERLGILGDPDDCDGCDRTTVVETVTKW